METFHHDKKSIHQEDITVLNVSASVEKNLVYYMDIAPVDNMLIGQGAQVGNRRWDIRQRVLILEPNQGGRIL